MKIDLIIYYKEVIQWKICLYIYFIRKNEFPYQLEYWKQQLSNSLRKRKKLLQEIQKEKPNYQLKLF